MCSTSENLQEGCADLSNSNRNASRGNRISEGAFRYDNATKQEISTRALLSENRHNVSKEQNSRGMRSSVSTLTADKKAMRRSQVAKQENQKVSQVIQMEDTLRPIATEFSIASKDIRQPSEVPKLEKRKEYLPSSQSYGYGSPQSEARGSISVKDVWDTNLGVRHSSTITSSNYGERLCSEPRSNVLKHRHMSIEPMQVDLNSDSNLGYLNTQAIQYPLGNSDADSAANWFTEYGETFGQDSSIYSPVPKLNCWVRKMLLDTE